MQKWGKALAAAALAVAGLAAGGAPARAAIESFDAQNWKPALDPYGYVTVDGAKTLEPFQFHVAAYFDWEHNPLKLTAGRPGGFGRTVIRDLSQVDLVAGLGIISFGHGGLEIGIDVPYIVDESGKSIGDVNPVTGAPKELPETSWGDPRTAVKLTLLDRAEDAIGIALKGEIQWPIGREKAFLNNRNRITPLFSLVIEKKMGILRFGGEIGYEYINQHTEVAGVTVDDKLKLGLAFAVEPFDEKETLGKLSFVVEAFHWARIGNLWKHEAESPIEIGGAIKWTGGVFALVGANAGLNSGVGSPDERVYASVGVTF